MPSPIGHALAGVAISMALPESTSRSGLGRVNWKVAGTCALSAALPDIDLLYMPIHRTITHSIPVAILMTIIAVLVTGQVNSKRQEGKKAKGQQGAAAPSGLRAFLPFCLPGLAIGLAWLSHPLMDWMGADANPPYGIQMWWPFSHHWFFSGWNIFPGTERRDPFGARAMVINLRAALIEIAIMGSIALAAWAARTAVRLKADTTDDVRLKPDTTGIRHTHRSRGRTFDRDDRPQPSGGAAGTGGISDRQDPRAGH